MQGKLQIISKKLCRDDCDVADKEEGGIMFQDSFQTHANRIAVVTEDGREISYQELNQLQEQVNRNFLREGLVLLVCSNTLDSLLIYLACLQHHHPVMLEDDMDMERFVTLLRQYVPEIVFLPAKFADRSVCLEEYQKCSGEMEDYICLKRNGSMGKIYSGNAVLLTTSGSTGSPKHVRISRENIRSNTRAIIASLAITKEDTTITGLGMSYSYGLSVIHTFLWSGARILLTERKVYTLGFWNFAKKYGVTMFFGVPSFYEMFVQFCMEQNMPDTLQVMAQAGGTMRMPVWEHMMSYAEEREGKFYAMYGQTEAAPRISCLPWEDGKRKPGSVGLPLMGQVIKILREDGEKATPNEEGEIICEGKNVSLGYAYNRTDLEKGDERNGILATGDIGYLDEDGYLYLTGRKGNYAKILGKRISLSDLEEILEERCQTTCTCIEKDGHIVLQGCTDESVIALLAKIIDINQQIFVGIER